MWLRVFPRVGSPPTVVRAGFRSPLFWLAFGNIGSATSAPPVVVVETFADHDGKPRPDRSAERNAEYREAQEALRLSVETAFERVLGEREGAAEPARSPTKQELREIAAQVLPEIRLDGFDASLQQVLDFLGEYQAVIAEARRLADDEEAMLVLLLA